MGKKSFLFLFLLIPIMCFSQQELKLTNVNAPGGKSEGVIRALIGQNLFGPKKVKFFGIPDEMVFQRNEKQKSGRGLISYDKLSTLYSGKIYSSGIVEPYIFENKTPEELVSLEIIVFPKMQGVPYFLYLDLKVQAMTKTIGSLSDDAGVYASKLKVKLFNLN